MGFRALSPFSAALAVLAALFAVTVFASRTTAQAAAEAAAATSLSGGVSSSMKAVKVPEFKIPGGGAGNNGGSGAASPHLIATNAPPPQETNVRDFQAHAGKDAGKILFRAAPAEAQVFINGKIVGKTPLLLVLAPGKYQIDMRGARGETGKSTVDLLPHETRELLVKLQLLYPGRVTAPKQ